MESQQSSLAASLSPIEITFITGNKGKLEEFQQLLEGSELATHYKITNKDISLDELQGAAEFIAHHKVKEAAKHVSTPVLIDDGSLYFNAFNGLPGPYIKCFLDRLSSEEIYSLLDAYEDKTGYAQLIYAYCETPESEPQLFIGRCEGTIVAPRGEKRGWDPIFQPKGYETTFGEMKYEEKNKISHRGKAFEQLKAFLEAKASKRVKGE
ncbi:hypothetical protein FGO68_gene2566 [Halteria grandinella]|uniref:Inosine triphosphate pyrophosphatase n=1 Tax=Halteria grandinella TaxID=5974 RepID=A0A8J8SYS9_HALGN|nr:hypothetical protein FGO68_gene2566 [Halteria grandinella]